MATEAPSAASFLAMAAPMPRELPVTMATLPVRRPALVEVGCVEVIALAVACCVDDGVVVLETEAANLLYQLSARPGRTRRAFGLTLRSRRLTDWAAK
jgi:hypothetical protein